MKKEKKNAFSVSSRIPENHHGDWILCAANPEDKKAWTQTLEEAIDDYEQQLSHRQVGPEMRCCKDWEDNIFKKKIKNPKMVRRPERRPQEEEPVELYQAMWDYQAQIPQVLNFVAGTILFVVKKFDNGWWHARLSPESPVGLVPYNYLQPYKHSGSM